MRIARRLVGFMAVCALAAACGAPATGPSAAPRGDSQAGSTTSPSSVAGSGDSPSSDGVDATAPVPETLRFEARTVSGEHFEGASLAGKPALLWFWAPWCPTCRGQIPQVKDIASTFGEEVNVVGVGGLDDAPAIAGFADDVPGILHLTDAEGEVWRHFGIAEQSSFVLLDASGKRVLTTGYGGADDLADRVGSLVD